MFKKLGAALVVSALSFALLGTCAQAETVTCSYYSNKYNGRRTASGQRFATKP